MVTLNGDILLAEFAMASRGRAFRWGSTDCVSLTRKALGVLHESDPWGDHIPSFKTKKSALAAAKSVDLITALETAGAVEVGLGYATTGDVAVGPFTDAHGLPATSIMVPGRRVLMSTVEAGVCIVPKTALPTGTRFFRHV